MDEYKDIWTLSEVFEGKLRSVSFELLAWGKHLADQRKCKLCSVVLVDKINESELNELLYFGADKVYVMQHSKLAHFLVQPYANILTYFTSVYKPEILIASATTFGRTLMPYLSVKLHTGLTADCTGLEIDNENGQLLQTRPAIGGNILATIRTPETRPQMATVRPKSSSPLDRDKSRKGELIYLECPEDLLLTDTQFIDFIPDKNQEVAIEDAEIIVSGGKGLKRKENFRLISDLAHTLGGAIGASRPPVDQGWQPYLRQIGLSGKTVSPSLYVACGISGAIQHLAGIQTAETIVAINNDPDAQIFNVADFGIVGDLFLLIPEIIKACNEFNENNS